MKRLFYFIFLIALLVMAFPALAQQDTNLITLDDATPAIDVVITLPPDATGTISLDLALAAVRLTDSNGEIVFAAADERLHGLEFNIAPNSGTHTLTVERLPGVEKAYVSVVSLPEMSIGGTVEFVSGNAITLNEETTLSLDANNPGGTVSVEIPTETIGVITATFPGASATTQLVDSNGVLLAESTGGHVDGLTFVLDGGSYSFTVLGSNLTETVISGVRSVSVVDSGFAVIEVPDSSTETVVNVSTSVCTATITASAVNLRSGPGTGYSVLGYAYRGESYPVGGQNQEKNWIVIGTQDGNSAWVSLSVAQMQGSCDTLTVFDIPTQNNAPAQITITEVGSNQEISRQQAIQIAEAAYPGTRAVDVKQEYERGLLVWEVKLSNRMEVYIDAVTGEIVYQKNKNDDKEHDDDREHDDDHDDDHHEDDD